MDAMRQDGLRHMFMAYPEKIEREESIKELKVD